MGFNSGFKGLITICKFEQSQNEYSEGFYFRVNINRYYVMVLATANEALVLSEWCGS